MTLPPTPTGSASTPTPDPAPQEQEARIADLATGFALGSLEEGELRELYELLRDDSGLGATAARITWQTMGIVTDLRAQVAHSFQDSVRLRIGQDRGGRFRSRLWKRLGFAVPSLAPVETPAASPGLSRFAWSLIVGGIASLVLATLVLLLFRGRPARATVIQLVGVATSAGRTLIPDSELDGTPFTIKPGGQLTLRWPDGSTAILTGDERADAGTPAVAAISAHGLICRNGRAWITAHSGFSLALPDHSATILGDETTVALEVMAGQSFLGVRHGAIHLDGVNDVLTDNGGFGPAGGFSWRWEWDAASGSVSPDHPAPADWRLNAEAYWSDPTDSARLTLIGADHETLVLICSPGLLTIQIDGHEVQHLQVPGTPLLGYQLELRQKQFRNLAITIADQSLSLTLPEPVDQYRLSSSPGATFKVTAFYPLPDPRPPMGTGGW